MDRIILFAVTIGQALITYFTAAVIHEGGHVVAGLIQGWRFDMMVVGPLKLYRAEDGKVKLGIEKDISLWGGVGGTIPPVKTEKRMKQYAAILLAGPMASVILGAVFCIIWILGCRIDELNTPPFLLILDGITDPHNLGAILRTADAMGVNAVIAPKDNSVGLNATVRKVACGAAESVPYITVTNLSRTIKALKERNIWILGADMAGASDLFHTEIPLSVAWVMGSEGKGMRRLTRENCDMLVSIPMFGTVESMNVSVSCGMLLAETRRQRSVI